MTVFILSDSALTTSDRDTEKIKGPLVVGTVSETKRLVDEAGWIQLPTWADKTEIAKLALNEARAAYEKDSSILPCDVLFLIWKQHAESFKGATMMEIGREVCDLVFTLGTESVPAFIDCDDDDGEGWKLANT